MLKPELKLDQVHPNAEGHRQLAVLIYRDLKKIPQLARSCLTTANIS